MIANTSCSTKTIACEFTSSLAEFESYRLDQGSVAYRERKDSKFLLGRNRLAELLSYLEPSFRVLEIEGERLQSYKNIYLDTPNFSFYLMHHNGQLNRYKVRERYYQNTREAFLEVKYKSSKARTRKWRIALPEVSQMKEDFLKSIIGKVYVPLRPSLRTFYHRISLMSHSGKQRLTIDFDIGVAHPLEDLSYVFKHLAIVELKEEKHLHDTDFTKAKRHFTLQEQSFSKYCVGCSLVYPQLKQNTFQPLLRQLEEMNNGL